MTRRMTTIWATGAAPEPMRESFAAHLCPPPPTELDSHPSAPARPPFPPSFHLVFGDSLHRRWIFHVQRLQTLHDNIGDHPIAKPLVIGRHDVPRRVLGRAPLQCFLISRRILLP